MRPPALRLRLRSASALRSRRAHPRSRRDTAPATRLRRRPRSRRGSSSSRWCRRRRRRASRSCRSGCRRRWAASRSPRPTRSTVRSAPRRARLPSSGGSRPRSPGRSAAERRARSRRRCGRRLCRWSGVRGRRGLPGGRRQAENCAAARPPSLRWISWWHRPLIVNAGLCTRAVAGSLLQGGGLGEVQFLAGSFQFLAERRGKGNFNTFVHEGARRTATSTPLSTNGHEGPRRTATATPLSAEGRGGRQRQHLHPRRGAKNGGGHPQGVPLRGDIDAQGRGGRQGNTGERQGSGVGKRQGARKGDED